MSNVEELVLAKSDQGIAQALVDTIRGTEGGSEATKKFVYLKSASIFWLL